MKEFVRKNFPFLVRLKNGLMRSVSRRRRNSEFMQASFFDVYQNNRWESDESVSGPGSELKQTEEIRRRLPEIIQKYNIKTFLDAPCGDFNWMKEVELGVDQYIGIDIVKDIILQNNHNHGNESRKFLHLDLANDELPQSDLVFCRDCIVHLSFEHGLDALRNIKKSGAQYLLTTTHQEWEKNEDTVTPCWRALNMQKPPFSFPAPLEIIDEKSTEQDGALKDKALGLWKISDLSFDFQ